MTLREIIASLNAASWLLEPQGILQHRGQYCLTETESKDLLKEARRALDAGDVTSATNAIFAGLALDESCFLAAVQERGILRISRYSYREEPLVPIVTALLEPGLGLSPAVVQYLEAVANLYCVATSLRKDYEELTCWLRAEREAGIKTLLALLDFLFLKKSVGFHETNNRQLPSRHPFFFSVERLAEGFSSILALYWSEIGHLQNNPAIPEDAVNQERYVRFLVSGCHLAVFREWEFQIDRQGYRLVATAEPNVYRLVPPSTEFLRAVELGFIQGNQQRTVKMQDWWAPNGKSFHDFAPKVARTMEKAGLIRLIERPAARYRFEFPGEILKMTAGLQELLQEERIALLQASRDLLTPPEDLLEFDVKDGLTFRDLFLVSRLMQFIRSITAAKLVPELETHPELVFQSLVPAFDRDTLVELLGTAVGKANAEKAVDIWTTDMTGHIDLQYCPLLPAGNAILMPVNVFADSNVFRNPLQVTRTRLYPDGSVDPLSVLLDKKFKDKGYSSHRSLKNGSEEVADVLALIDGILFVFECKNSLVPTGAHELMTSLDYIRTAAEQLNGFRQCFATPEFRAWLAQRTGWHIDGNTRLATGIVMSNRMFIGLRVNGHPVRGAYELEQFVDEGTVAMGEESRKYWLGASFSGEDLRRYLEEDITYHAQWKCLRSFEEEYGFSDCHVLVDRLYLDSVALAEHLGFEKAKRELLKQQAAFEKAVTSYSVVKQYRRRNRELQLKEQRKDRCKRRKELERRLKNIHRNKGR